MLCSFRSLFVNRTLLVGNRSIPDVASRCRLDHSGVVARVGSPLHAVCLYGWEARGKIDGVVHGRVIITTPPGAFKELPSKALDSFRRAWRVHALETPSFVEFVLALRLDDKMGCQEQGATPRGASLKVGHLRRARGLTVSKLEKCLCGTRYILRYTGVKLVGWLFKLKISANQII